MGRRLLAGPEATEALGRALGRRIEPGDLLALHGDLGAGKTTLVRGLVAGLGGDSRRVASPTFVLHHVYGGGRVTLHHIDLYRLGDCADTAPFDLDDLLDGGAAVVEWAELGRLEEHRPVHVHLEVPDPEHRVAVLDDPAPGRFAAAFDEAPETP